MSITKTVFNNFKAANDRFGLLKKGDRVVVAVSGGVDSSALMLLVKLLRRKWRLEVWAAHLDHQIQSKKTRDKFIKSAAATAKALQIPFILGQRDVRQMSLAQKVSLEEAGRNARYDFLSKTAVRVKANKIATAHNFDDQVETVLMRILRGTGLRGLSGIPPKRREGALEVIRPLIQMRKSELIAFTRAYRLKFTSDPSNTSDEFTRNKIRRKLLPYLRKNFNPGVDSAISQLQAIAFETTLQFDQDLPCVSGDKLPLSKLQKMAPAVRSGIFSNLYFIAGGRGGLGYKHRALLTSIVMSKEEGLQVPLPGGFVAVKKSGQLAIVAQE